MNLLSRHDSSSQQPGKVRLAQGLGWLSIGLGIAELLVPRAVSKLMGVPHRPIILGLLGIREIATGIGILRGREISEWLRGRVAGDVMDLSLLGAALASDESDVKRVEAAAAVVLGVTALDVLAARSFSANASQAGVIHFRKTITINRSPSTVYSFWRNFENLPRFMHNLESVTMTGLTHSHWVAKAPGGQTVEWEAEILEDVPDHLISWRSLAGSNVENCGAVRFEEAPEQQGTIVHVDISYRAPGGRFGAAVAKLFGKGPDRKVQSDLRRFKQVLETGHIVTTEGESGVITGNG